MKILKARNRIVKDYNKKAKNEAFQVGELILKKIELSKYVGKLDPK